MSSPDKAFQTQIDNIQKKTGKSLAELSALVTASGLARHGVRPIHDALMKKISTFGVFEVVPKKGYVSLRRKKQFAMIGPKTNTRFEVGINAKELASNPRLLPQPTASMCPYVVNVGDASEVNPELIGWIRSAYENAG